MTSSPTKSEAYEFADLRLDVAQRELVRIDSGERIPLPDKAFDTLCVLVRNAGKLVGKDELISQVWADTIVEENNLNKSIYAIRRALGESSGEQKFVETVKKHGYRFVAEVRLPETPAPESHADRSDTADAAPRSNVHSFPRPVLVAEQHGSPAVAIAARRGADSVEDVLQPANSPVQTTYDPPSHSRRKVAAAAVALLMIFAVGGSLAYRSWSTSDRNAAGAAKDAAVRLAVLPVKPVTPDGRDPGFELAIADSLILKLNSTKVFQVAHLSAVRNFADVDVDPTESGRSLGVDYVLASNYQTAEGKIRVTSQLINVGTGATEQTFKAESTTDNLFAMQDAVANDIGNAVLARFGKPATSFASDRGTANDEAVNLYYEAFYLLDKSTKNDSAKAADLLGQAVLIDPNYAQAWALRAQAYCQFAHNGGGKPDMLFTIAEPMLDKAISLDRDNATAFLVKGVINRDYHWKFADAYADLRRAISIDPNSWLAHRELAVLYHHDGRFDDAVEEVKIALEINPTSVVNRWVLGFCLLAAGRRDEGVAQLERVIEMDPNFAGPYDTLSQLYHREGDGQKAYANFIKLKELSGARPEHIARLKNSFPKGGWPAVLRAEFDQMKIEDPKDSYSGSKYYMAGLAASTGDRDAAFEYLEQARRYHYIGLSWIKVDRRLDPLRTDPRFNDVLRETGLGG